MRYIRAVHRLLIMLITGMLILGALRLPVSAAEILWSRQFGTATDDYARSVTVDPNGNIYVAGSTSAVIDSTFAGGSDGYIRKYNSSGTPLWTRDIGTTGNEQVWNSFTDGTSNTILVGETSGTLAEANAGGIDAFIRKYDSGGTPLWTHEFGTSGTDRATAAIEDGTSNTILLGETTGVLSNTNAGGIDYFIRKYDSGGTALWTRQFGSAIDDHATGVALDGSGNIYVAGYTFAMPAVYTGYIRKHDPDGNILWTREIGTIGNTRINQIFSDGSVRTIVAGTTNEQVDSAAFGGLDGFLREYDESGNILWTRQWGTSADDTALCVSIDGHGNYIVAGETAGSLGGPNAGGTDAYARKYDIAGNIIWTRQFGTSGDDRTTRVVTDGTSNTILFGETRGTLPGQNTNAGGSDLYLLKLSALDRFSYLPEGMRAFNTGW